MKQYEYDAVLHEDPDSGGAYVAFPWDIRQEFGKGRVKVHALFDGITAALSIRAYEQISFRCESTSSRI